MTPLDELRLWILFFQNELMTIDQLETRCVEYIDGIELVDDVDDVLDAFTSVRDAIITYRKAFVGGIPTELVDRRADLDRALKGAVT